METKISSKKCIMQLFGHQHTVVFFFALINDRFQCNEMKLIECPYRKARTVMLTYGFIGFLISLQLWPVVHGITLKVAWFAPYEENHYLKAASSMGGLALSVDTIETSSMLPNHDFT